MSGAGAPQVFVRNDKGQTWGPLALPTVTKLIETGQIPGRVLVSEDGVHFAFPIRFPHLREAFPRELWGTAPPAGNGNGNAAPRPAQPAPSRSPAPVLTPAPAPASAPLAPPPPAASSDPAEPFSIASETLPASGDLSKISPVRLYAVAALKQLTGQLSLKLADCVVDVHFRKGNPELVESTHPDDSLETFLLSQRLVDKDRLAAAKQAGGDLVSTLFAQGLLQPATAFSHLLRRSTFILHRALYANAGFFTFTEGAFAAHKAMPLGHRWGLLADFVRKIPAPELKHRMRGDVDRAMLKSTGAIEVHDLKLTPQETRALGGVDGVRSLAQLCAEAPQDAETYLRLGYLLRELELVSFNRPAEPRAAQAAKGPASATNAAPPTPSGPAATSAPRGAPAATNSRGSTAGAAASNTAAPTTAASGPATSARPAAARATAAATPSRPIAPTPPPGVARPTPAPVAVTPKTPPPGPVAPDVAQLRAFLAKLKEQTHFERLGLTDKADATAVKMAYFKLARLYHPDTVSPEAGADVMKLNEGIFSAIGEAYRVLIDPASRANYEEELRSGAGEFDIQQLLQAEEHFHKATLLVKGRRFDEALKLLDDAIQMNPEEGEFYAWRGYARFFVTPDKKVALAAANKDLQLALKKNEKCAIAWFHLGQLAKLTGDTATALKHFKSTLELQPHHIDAQREVRLLTKK